MTMLRRVFETLSAQEGVELPIKQMKTTKSNNEFLSNLQKQAGLTNN
jgi:transcription termination factor Rho